MELRCLTMIQNNLEFASVVAQSLGANRVVELPGLPGQGPLDLLTLRAEVARLMSSTAQQPADTERKVPELVPLREVRWLQLQELAVGLSTDSRKVSAAQIAAILIERALEQIGPAGQRP